MAEVVLTSEPETSMVSNTEFEKLMLQIKKEANAMENSELNCRRRIAIKRSIISVYWFLRCEGMPERPITLEEFEVANTYLMKCAQRFVAERQGWTKFFLKLGKKYRQWRCFNEYNYFPTSGAPPWGRWEFIRYYDSAYGSEVEDTGYLKKYLPPNIEELCSLLFQQYYPKEL